MRKRIWIPLAISVLLLIGLYNRSTKPKAGNPSVGPEHPTGVENQSTEPERTLVRRPRRNAKDVSTPSPIASQSRGPMTPRPNRAEQIEYAIRNANQPINFYGKVVDQNDTPVPGVKIHILYTEHLLVGTTYGENNNPVDLVTSDDGRFALTGVKGSRISIETVSKSGYQLSPKALLTPGINSDPSDPVIFKMWKKQGADRLISVRLSRQAISVEGAPVTFDLFEGK